MGNIQLHAHGGGTFCQSLLNGFTGCAFHQGNHAGGGVDQQTAGTYTLCGILFLNKGTCFAFHTNSNFHK